jgi:hypothetical protein
LRGDICPELGIELKCSKCCWRYMRICSSCEMR